MTDLLQATVRPLFADVPTEKAFAERKKKARAAIAALTADVRVPGDLPRLRTQLVQKYRLDTLQVDWGACTTEPAPSRTADHGAPGSMVAVFVPFSGTPGLFDMTPTQRQGEPPVGYIRYDEPIEGERIKGELVLVIPAKGVDAGRELARQRARVDEWVAASATDVLPFNREVSEIGRAEFMPLEHEMRRVADLALKLGPPHEPRMTRRDDRRPSRSWAASAGDLALTTPPRGPGRPSWPVDLRVARYAAAVAATPEPRTHKAIAAHFRPLSGRKLGVSPDHLRRLRKRIETDPG
jgi:hypothetical protein